MKWDFHPEETYKSLITIAIEVLKTLALVNGGAAVAILAYLGNLTSREPARSLPNMTWALVSFALGLFLTVLAFIVAYLTQLQLYNEDLTKDSEEAIKGSASLGQPVKEKELKVPLGRGRAKPSVIPAYHRGLLWTAIILVILAALAFAGGCVIAALVFAGLQ
jgi:ABC-type sugar transport system permease subunit